jgi:hypothetical protein
MAKIFRYMALEEGGEYIYNLCSWSGRYHVSCCMQCVVAAQLWVLMRHSCLCLC